MSFVFPSWSTAFSPAFHEDAKAMLEGALNKGDKPPVIQGKIEVVELHMGEQPPTLTLLEIGDLSIDRFRGILRLGYQGDAWLEVRCRVQANPLSHNPHLTSSTLPLSTPLLASQPLLVPMTLRLSKLHLRAILILVVSASKGITLVFKNDPLQNVDVSSTFDSVEVIRGYLQQEIEGQLREMFREHLPSIIHRLSQKWFSGSGVGGKVEMPYRDTSPVPSYAPINEEVEEEENEENHGSSPGNEGSFPPRHIGPGGITLPLNNSVSQLAALSYSAHTLSPYARGHEHIAVRSFPYLGKNGAGTGSSGRASLASSSVGEGDIKAKRKRIFRIGKSKEADEKSEI
ncbi:mitochondrial distribution and morphology protein 34 [Cryptococcus neoformans C23]|uniref:Mitochondrial distribution and morphology protein 34 n=2 Tax=Cryptococcus neoformans TaxID=5207 RepID=A0A854QK84_CRYNE|nr:mitochondrial distribution and morphology protein 34 [Cryptococcus neoformans var. grubii H99]AUB25336.1 mitochondrial distribution and morphology protein 34 [Cryptococcus neoformans var. grubii]OWZ31596.1 mitochondrial distribution and morphology protein 34 [Cryptococcus neoformans var. grubii AD2-60a]OWZ42726.1 mitochondrial distribution and morphology protein 34 [Cryptococcus neoformans var. grubii AD1-83a]OWZ43413.1 mitochondrial distribution and morphology protein 34 [Cryptococcus neofo|eukprot:XP_012050065.1 mitochondrial distribution and morphology protein 34 [Cryptococcus neoformans var. grubii H99]